MRNRKLWGLLTRPEAALGVPGCCERRMGLLRSSLRRMVRTKAAAVRNADRGPALETRSAPDLVEEGSALTGGDGVILFINKNRFCKGAQAQRNMRRNRAVRGNI